MSSQEAGQASTIAAGAFDRPHPLALMAASQLQQLLVAGRGRRNGDLLNDRAADCLDDRGGVGVLWVSTPMTSSTTSASMAMR
jgi:hypothetical protein